MILKELNPVEFDDFVKNFNPKTPYQTSAYGSTMSGENYYSYYLGLMDNDKIVAATFIMIKSNGAFKYGYAPRGFLIDYQNTNLVDVFSKELKKYLNKKDVIAIKLNPMIVKNIYDSNYNLIGTNPNYDNIFSSLKKLGFNHLGYNNFFESFKPRFDAIIEINKDYYELFTHMSKGFRTKVRSAEVNGVRIYKGNASHIEILYEQEKDKYKKSLNYYQNIFNNFSKGNMVEIYYAKLDITTYLTKNQNDYLKQEQYNNKVNAEVISNHGKSHQKLLNKKIEADKTLNLYHQKLVQASNLMAQHPSGIIIATVMVTKIGDTVNVFIDSFDKNYNSFNAKHLIIWKLIEKFSKEGYNYFNLGGITNKVDKTNKYHGLNSYKLGFGAKVYEYIGDLEFVINKPKYIMFRNAAPLFRK